MLERKSTAEAVGHGSGGRSPELSHLPGMMRVMGYRSARKTVDSATYHLIWCSKDRRRVLVGGVDARPEAIVAEVAHRIGAEVIEVEVLSDHVLLLAEVSPTVPLSRLVGLLRSRPSRLLGMGFPRLRRLPALWSRSWFVSTVGGAPSAVVHRDVAYQRAVAGR
jgi:putative transposase